MIDLRRCTSSKVWTFRNKAIKGCGGSGGNDGGGSGGDSGNDGGGGNNHNAMDTNWVIKK